MKLKIHGIGCCSVRKKLIIFFSLLIALISLCVFLYVPAKIEKQALAALNDKANSIAGMTAFSVGGALFFEDIRTIDEVLQSTKQNKDVIYVIVTDSSGRFITGSGAGIAEQAGFSQAQQIGNLSDDGRIYMIMAPIMQNTGKNDKQIGRLYLGLSMNDLREELFASRKAVSARLTRSSFHP